MDYVGLSLLECASLDGWLQNDYYYYYYSYYYSYSYSYSYYYY